MRDASAVGKILACPKCGSMVQITPPEGWEPPATTPGQPATKLPSAGAALTSATPPPQPIRSQGKPENRDEQPDAGNAAAKQSNTAFDRAGAPPDSQRDQKRDVPQRSALSGSQAPSPAPSRKAAVQKQETPAQKKDEAATSAAWRSEDSTRPKPLGSVASRDSATASSAPQDVSETDAGGEQARSSAGAAANGEQPLKARGPRTGRGEGDSPRATGGDQGDDTVLPTSGQRSAKTTTDSASSSSSSWALEVRPRKTPPLQPARGSRAVSSRSGFENAMPGSPPVRSTTGADDVDRARNTGNLGAASAMGGGSDELPVWMSTAEVRWQQRLFVVGGVVSGLIIAAAVVGHWMARGPSAASSSPSVSSSVQQSVAEPQAASEDKHDSSENSDEAGTELPAGETGQRAAGEADATMPQTGEPDGEVAMPESQAAETIAGTADPVEAQTKGTSEVSDAEEATSTGADRPTPDDEAEARRLAVARTTDETHHRRLVGGLLSYHDVEGAFPPSAGGIVQLAPESRLSWIALLLAYYDRPAWQKQLNFRRSWKDRKNQPITRQTLDLVINPLLERKQTDDGYPVTHYVGLSGVGPDAGMLPANHPRAGLFGVRRRVTREMVVDGLSNTIALMGVSDRLGPWSAGGSATVRALTAEPYINGPDGFGSGRPDGVVAAMADGSVRFLSKDIDPRVLEQMATIAGERGTHLAGERVRNGPRNGASSAPSGRSVATAPPERATAKSGKPGQSARTTTTRGDRPSHAGKESNTRKGSNVDRDAMQRNGDGASANGAVKDDAEAAADDEATPEWLARLERPVEEIELSNVRLSDLIQLLSDLAAVPIRLDVEALTRDGVTPDTKVSLRMRRSSVRQMLDEIASQLNVTIELRPDGIVLSADESDRASGASQEAEPRQ